MRGLNNFNNLLTWWCCLKGAWAVEKWKIGRIRFSFPLLLSSQCSLQRIETMPIAAVYISNRFIIRISFQFTIKNRKTYNTMCVLLCFVSGCHKTMERSTWTWLSRSPHRDQTIKYCTRHWLHTRRIVVVRRDAKRKRRNWVELGGKRGGKVKQSTNYEHQR